MLSTLAFGAIGFADDYLKVVKKRSLGLSARLKLRGQVARRACVLGTALYVLSQIEPTQYSTRVIFPFFKNLMPDSRPSTSCSRCWCVVGAAERA